MSGKNETGTFSYGLPVPEFGARYPDVLACPLCGGTNLHHYFVTAYNRSSEDGETQAVGSGALLHVGEPLQLPNPSLRRDSVGVRFWCEGCPDSVELCVIQHKGSTFLSWRPIKDEG